MCGLEVYKTSEEIITVLRFTNFHKSHPWLKLRSIRYGLCPQIPHGAHTYQAGTHLSFTYSWVTVRNANHLVCPSGIQIQALTRLYFPLKNYQGDCKYGQDEVLFHSMLLLDLQADGPALGPQTITSEPRDRNRPC
jgi:hypothetical protein